MAILDFSVSGWQGFSSITQVCFGISVSNFMCMSFVAVGRSLTIISYVAFKMAALWFWTMFNCNPPIAHCHPLLWGGGILVDHWSTISSFFLFIVGNCTSALFVVEMSWWGPILHWWAYNPNHVEMCVAFTENIMIRSGYYFVHVMIAQLSWHVQNSDLIW